ncbi:hypothetical protein LUZ62_031855 [Rhynchospora pubera]|uniref:Ferritin-like superfamily n=1 Tax=Rhynchospora pubera TaxID=906938 RepID=A0AAV8HNS6_9POAL|nr:hypothetical protein LUZ62_076944 [Rhynchospora pubera]KAJ4819289.1 hypothetical protein LUZ62_031855 [Rhynchospora pubera]
MERREEEAETLVEAALRILNEADPVQKARLGEDTGRRWLDGSISLAYRPSDPLPQVPDRPARLSTVKLVAPNEMHKLGKGGSLQSRQAMVHSLVHTESWAIDLSWDIIARFGTQELMPREFFTDFVMVALDEGRHFTLLSARLEEMGSFYGALPAHDGLWDSALETSSDLLSRLAVEHCVHEARGLDVLPTTIERFRKGGDEITAKLLESVIYPEEITHCAAGIRWFRYLSLRSQTKVQQNPSSLEDAVNTKTSEDLEEAFQQLDTANNQSEDEKAVIQKFHSVVRRHFHGPLKPPFNVEARKAAGFDPEWYEPLAIKEVITGD